MGVCQKLGIPCSRVPLIRTKVWSPYWDVLGKLEQVQGKRLGGESGVVGEPVLAANINPKP